MADRSVHQQPAFYGHRGSRWGDWWTLLHPPYTLWHLSYCVIGAALAPHVDRETLVATVLAFFLAVGIAAHALDELQGRPLRTTIGSRTLWAVSVISLAAACCLGAVGVARGVWLLAVCIPLGVLLVLGYNLELLGGRLHTDLGFAVAWGGFPVAVGLVAQDPPWDWELVVALPLTVVAASALSYAQRKLSNQARLVRRRALAVDGVVHRSDGTEQPIDERFLLTPLEGALRGMALTVPALAVALLLVR